MYFVLESPDTEILYLNINELYEKARSGDKAAERQLFSTLTVRFRALTVQRIGASDDCDDIVQNAVMAISKEYKKIEFTVSFSAWAHKVLQIRMLKYFSTKKRKAAHEAGIPQGVTSEPAFKPDPTLETGLIECFKKISGLNRNYARVLNLCYQGYSTEEICEKLAISTNHSYVILSRARSMLKLCLEKGDVK